MKCAWQEFLSVLPPSMRTDVNAIGKDTLQELRMRAGMPPELVFGCESIWLPINSELLDLEFVMNTASRYSPWLTETLSRGYLTAPGGHRIGVCGEVVIKDGKMVGIRKPTSLCIRIARDFPGMIRNRDLTCGSVLIIGQPGSGKTTFLRDLIRLRSNSGSIAVVDERGEIFPYASDFFRGKKTDVMIGCSKKEGIVAVLRSMGPETIAVDEITSEIDCESILHAAWCGVSLIATAHAGSIDDLHSRPVYRPLINARIFDTLVTMQKDKSWAVERIGGKG